jgi:hypothetical protein
VAKQAMLPGFSPEFITVWFWMSYFISLGFSFLIYKIWHENNTPFTVVMIQLNKE